MAAPIITGTTPPSPVAFAPGETKSIRVNAFDPDAGAPVTWSFSASDTEGNSASGSVTLQVSDPLSYSAGAPPSGWTVTQDAADPALFHVTAPGS